MKWKKITDCSKHEISEDGRVRNIISGKYLKNAIDRYGYEKIHLIKDNGKDYHPTIHRLVASAFVDGKFPGAQVNHMDGNKLNNHYTNLEWVTGRQNSIHALDNLLNKNTNKVTLFNIITKEIKDFRSLKSLAAELKIRQHSLIPLIRFSDVNPILNKYVIKFVNEDSISEPSNIKNFGIPIYVLDEYNNEIKTYQSMNLARYYTCVRSIPAFKDSTCIYSCIGYHFSFNIDDLRSLNLSPESNIKEIREKYILKPYMKNDFTYYLYDYYTGIEKTFNNIGEMLNYFKTDTVYKNITKEDVSQALGRGHRELKSGLLKGYGVKSSKHNYEWFPYLEETIITNRNSRLTLVVYRININGTIHDIIGKYELCKFMNYFPDKQLKDITIEEIVKFSNIPNISIVRLNKPIKNQDEDIV